VDAIERLYPDRQAEQVERLAHHAARGKVWDKAAGYLHQAGTKTAARSAHREAITYFEQALDALSHLPGSRETREQAVDLHLDMRNSLLPLREFEPIHDHLRAAEAIAVALDDRRRLGWVSMNMSNYYWLGGHYGRAVAFGQRGLELGTAIEDFALQIEARFYLALTYHIQADYGRAMALLRQNVAALTGELRYDRLGTPRLPAAVARVWLAWCLTDQGRFGDAIAAAQEAVQITETVEQPFSAAFAYWQVGTALLGRGDFSRSIPILERGLEVCQTWHIALAFPWVAATLGYTYVLSGRLASGLTLLEKAPSGRLAPQYVRARAWLAEAYLQAERRDDATGVAVQALEVTRTHEQRGDEALTLRLLGEIAAQADPPEVEQALSYYREALTLADELGMHPLVAHCHLGLGTLYQKLGRREQAETELTTAAVMYRAMEMTFWLEQAATTLAQVAG
jgi:tetratricopeptide (TPR) repeat protein